MEVVLLHDGSHDLDAVREAVSGAGGQVIATESSATALTALMGGTATVLMVAISSTADERVELATRVRDQVWFNGSSVLLCKGRQSEDAFRLCEAGVFQDYVSIDPLYDVFRLRLAVHQAMHRRDPPSEGPWVGLGQDIGEVRKATADVSADFGDGMARVIQLVRKALANDQLACARPGESSASGAADASVVDEALALRDRQTKLLGNIDLRLRNLESAVCSALRPDQGTVLLVDDDPLVYEVLSSAVESLGFTLAWTMNATEATSRARSLRPKVVLLDIVMPAMCGLDVLREIRRDSEVGRVPVILLTGKQDVQTVMAARQLGVDGYLVKPPNRTDLLEKLRHLTQAVDGVGAR